jgi:hypothetical protein
MSIAQRAMNSSSAFRSASVAREKLYTPMQAAVAALLGGVLASVVVLRSNFLALDDRAGARQVMSVGGAILIGLPLLGYFTGVLSTGSNVGLTIIVVALTRYVVERRQLGKQAIAEAEEYTFQSAWRVLGVGIGSLLVYLAFVLALFAALNALG